MGEWQISQVRVTASIKWSSQVGSSRLKNGQVASIYASIHYKSQIFNVKYNAIIEIVECELRQVAQKWSSASRICEYAGILAHSLFVNLRQKCNTCSSG